jgi:hypothetical protein
MRDFFLFAHIQFLNYLLIYMNYRMVARGSYLGTGITDAIILLINFTVIQRVAAAHSYPAQAGFIIGGVLGAQLGLWLTRRK